MKKNLIIILTIILLSSCDTTEPLYFTTVTTDINIYTSASFKSDLLRKIIPGEKIKIVKSGETVTLYGVEGNWVKIKTNNNEIGWCFDAYLIKLDDYINYYSEYIISEAIDDEYTSDMNKFNFFNDRIYFDKYLMKIQTNNEIRKQIYVYNNYIVAKKYDGTWLKGLEIYNKDDNNWEKNISKDNIIYETDLTKKEVIYEVSYFRGIYKDHAIVSNFSVSEYENLEIYDLKNGKLVFNSDHNSKSFKVLLNNELLVYEVVSKEIDDSGIKNGIGKRKIIYNLKEIYINLDDNSIRESGKNIQTVKYISMQ